VQLTVIAVGDEYIGYKDEEGEISILPMERFIHLFKAVADEG
jgi:hypothetical protein